MWIRSSLVGVAFLLSGCVVSPHMLDVVELTLDAGTLQELEVRAEAGDLDIRGTPGATDVWARVELWSTAPDDCCGQGILEAHLWDDGGGVGILDVEVDAGPHYWADLVVELPPELFLRVDDGSGDLLVEDVGGLSLVDGSGDAWIAGISGPAQITDGSGDLHLEGVQGDVRVEDGTGDLAVLDVDGDVDILDGSGDILVERVTGTVTIDDGSGDIHVSDAGDVIILESGTGDVIVE